MSARKHRRTTAWTMYRWASGVYWMDFGTWMRRQERATPPQGDSHEQWHAAADPCKLGERVAHEIQNGPIGLLGP